MQALTWSCHALPVLPDHSWLLQELLNHSSSSSTTPAWFSCPSEPPLHSKCCKNPFSWREKEMTGPSATVPLGAHSMGCHRPRVTSRCFVFTRNHPRRGSAQSGLFPEVLAHSCRVKDSLPGISPVSHSPGHAGLQAGSRQSCHQLQCHLHSSCPHTGVLPAAPPHQGEDPGGAGGAGCGWD